MSPKKQGPDTESADYQSVFNRCCRETDVLIIPEIERCFSLADIRERKQQEEVSPDDTCAPPVSPVVYVLYDWTDSGESPVSVSCKFIYVEYALIRAIFLTFPTFSTITCLRIDDCCVSHEVVRVVALLLSDQSGANIVELSLNGNPDISKELPVLFRTKLKYLSLKRCSLNDEDVSLFAHELSYTPERDQKLLTLNLGMNKIGDEGALALAAALRTNRTLVSLSLYGNHITDAGAMGIADVLDRFSLSTQEVACRRRAVYDRLFERKRILDRFMEEWKSRKEAEGGVRAKTSADKVTGKRAKSIEVSPLKRSISSRDKRRTASSSRMSSREKPAGGRRRSIEPTHAEMEEMMSRVQGEMTPERNPFITEVKTVGDEFFCDGSWRLGNLNLAYNRLTEESIDRFLSVIYYQDKFLPIPNLGLLRLIIQPGNSIPRGSPKVAELECAIKSRRERPHSDPSVRRSTTHQT